MAGEPMRREVVAGPAGRQRLPLGRSPRRLSFERRMRLGLWLMALPALGLGAALLLREGAGAEVGAAALAAGLLGWWAAVTLLLEGMVRPLQTLANVLAALREDDYSFRARGGRRDDAVGDLALEVNALAASLQARRAGDMEASALLEQVMAAMPSPVLAFAPSGTLRLVNAAARRAFGLPKSAPGQGAAALGLHAVLGAAHDELLSMRSVEGEGAGQTRWIVQRSSFRLRGVPHTLLVLSDVSTALREEERLAWKRLIRVISHEVNNSLTPIKSIAGSLRSAGSGGGEWERGLLVIESRAESLNRFLQSYSQLAGLPAPQRTRVGVRALLERVCSLETRVPVELLPGPEATIDGDADQLQQALINLVRNGAEAALSAAAEGGAGAEAVSGDSPGTDAGADAEVCGGGWQGGASRVVVRWQSVAADVMVLIEDTGAGIANQSNLFVPFYTTKATGSGIGLVLSLQIIEAHGGTLRLRNRGTGRGCEAEVRLPLAPAR